MDHSVVLARTVAWGLAVWAGVGMGGCGARIEGGLVIPAGMTARLVATDPNTEFVLRNEGRGDLDIRWGEASAAEDAQRITPGGRCRWTYPVPRVYRLTNGNAFPVAVTYWTDAEGVRTEIPDAERSGK